MSRDLKESKVQVIAAQPGWFVLEFDFIDSPPLDEFLQSPILAWRIETSWIPHTKYRDLGEWDSDAIPIAAESFADNYAILQPNGVVVFPEDRRFPSIAEALEYARAFLMERQKHTEKRKQTATNATPIQ